MNIGMQTQVKTENNKVIVTIGKRKVTLRGWAALQFAQIDSGATQYAGASGRDAAVMFAGDCGTIGTD